MRHERWIGSFLAEVYTNRRGFGSNNGDRHLGLNRRDETTGESVPVPPERNGLEGVLHIPHACRVRVPRMVLESLRLRSFRAHERTECDLAPSINLLFGPNGAGKTNVLEAIHYLCLSKGFVSSSDRYILRLGDGHVEVSGHFRRDDGRDVRVRLAYVPGEGKQFFVNGAPLERLSDLIGRLPAVVYSPQDHALTTGGPEERRRFMDNLLSQARPAYLDSLLKYRRVLKQRNRLLGRYRDHRTGPPAALLDPWNEELIHLGSRIIAVRSAFTSEFAGFLEEAYREIEFAAERPTLQYGTLEGASEADEAKIASIFRRALEDDARNECRRGLSLVGPHRDELVFRLNTLLVRRYASQGQHRTFGMAMKLAKYFYLRERTGEAPLLLLDDVFDHLDRRRSGAFLQLLQSSRMGQTVITATDRRGFEDHVSFSDTSNRALLVEDGAVRPTRDQQSVVETEDTSGS